VDPSPHAQLVAANLKTPFIRIDTTPHLMSLTGQ
jgi:hypothetical protein